MKPIVKIALPVVILLAALAVFAALRATKPEQQPAQIKERVWRVAVEPVQPRTLTPRLTLYGQLETPSLFKAAAPASARVDRVLVREGDRVISDQPLVTLDERDFLPQLDQARADVAELEAQLRSEDARYQSDLEAQKQEQKLLALYRGGVDRARRLQKKQLGSDSALDQAEQELARQSLAVTSRALAIADHPARRSALEARLRRAHARQDEIALDYERSRVRAPYAGIVAQVQVAEGDQVADNAVLLSLYDPARLEVRARIPAPFQGELQQALSGGLTLRGETKIGSGQVVLRLVRLAGEADPSGVDALFRVERGGEWLRSGQMLRFTLDRAAQEDSVPVPYQSVYGGNRIYRLIDGRLRGLQVETLGNFLDEQGRERLLVRAPGLNPGENLVTTQLPNAIEGLRAEAVESR